MNQNLLQEGISVPNAGLVILNAYFKMLFDRLGLLEENQFKNRDAQYKAVHCLQFLATGQTATEEHLLSLNKVLCGVDIASPTSESIEIPETEKELMEGLIKAAIEHWSAIGKSSVMGFRGNWLVRDGILREEEDRWELIVEKRSYDILLQRSPFSFSIIRMPWMEKPLHIIWNY